MYCVIHSPLALLVSVLSQTHMCKKVMCPTVGGSLLLTIVGLGTYSNACALEGPAGVNDDIKLWLDANPKYVSKDAIARTKLLEPVMSFIVGRIDRATGSSRQTIFFEKSPHLRGAHD